MLLLIAGLCLWAGAHLYPSLASAHRKHVIERLGIGPYKGLFAVTIIVSIVLIVLGWRSIEPVFIYRLSAVARYLIFICVFLTAILFIAARTRNSINRLLRHPQLTGVVLWSIGHLLVNGDNRSLLLFGGIGAWAVLEMFMINRREGKWIKPAPVSVRQDSLVIGGGVALFAVLWLLHPYLAGISISIR